MAAAQQAQTARLDVSDVVRAAGGIIRRPAADGGHEVVLVHRPAYDDWSFPKGKLEADETEADAAMREVEEETGLRCILDRELGIVSYVDSRGRPKTVRYWEMVVDDDARPVAGNEVDEARWVHVKEAHHLLSYTHDRDVLARALDAERQVTTVPMYLVRHVKAENRATWQEPDELRPISKAGRQQAERLVWAFEGAPLTRLLSSPFLRCIQTLEPLADARGIEIELSSALSEGEDPSGALDLLVAAAADGPAALSTHGDVMMSLIEDLVGRGIQPEDGKSGFKKGCIWTLGVLDGEVVTAKYVPPP
jgi:8-oxo-(d)GTP phosphatase